MSNLSSYNWEEKFQNYSPENKSRMATITTCFLLLLRFLKDEFANIEQLVDDSIKIRHYWDSKDEKHEFEKIDERQFGGLYGFAGNTYKIVKDSESNSGFSLLGSNYYNSGNISPLADVVRDVYPDNTKILGIGLLELIK